MNSNRIKYIYIALCVWLLTASVCIAQPLWTESDPPKHEMRAVWLTTLNGLDWPRTKATSEFGRLKQQSELCAILDQLKAVGINTVLLQTRVRGSVIYPSAIEPWDVALTGQYGGDPGYDPLAFAIAETHRRGMELHAWVVTIPCFKVAVAKQMGKRSVLKTHPELCRRHTDMYYLDPGHPGTAAYLKDICHEIVSRYDVDGIHFDYIRYPEQAASFNDAATFRRFGRGKNKAVWRRDNITAIVRQIHDDVKAIKPWVRVSSSPVGKYADLSRYSSRGWNARDAVSQDAEGWLREGIHDILFPMMYFDGNHFYPFAADWQEQSADRLVVPGLGIYFLHPAEKDWPLTTVQRQLNYIRTLGLGGQCYFRSDFLTADTKGLYTYLRSTFYAFPALPPACTWIDNEPPAAPVHPTVTPINDRTEELSWQPAEAAEAEDAEDAEGIKGSESFEAPKSTKAHDGSALSESVGAKRFSRFAPSSATGNYLRYNVYASRTWPVDITRAEHLVATLLPEPCFRYDRINALNLYFAVTAIDRAGNESPALQLSASPQVQPAGRLKVDANGHIEGLIRRPLPPSAQKKQKRRLRKSK